MTITDQLPPPAGPPAGVSYRCELDRLGVDGFDEGDELPDEYRQLITQVVLLQADIESELVFDSSVLRAHLVLAPDSRSKMRMARFFAEEVGHGFTFWRLAKGLGIELTPRYFREAKRRRQEAFSHVGDVSSWVELAVVNTLTDRVGVFVFADTMDCSYRPWAAVSVQNHRDEVGHAALGYTNLRDQVLRHGRRDEAQRQLEKWYPLALDMFGRSDSERQWRYVAWGIKRSGNEELRRAWVAEVKPLLEELGLDVPDYAFGRHFL